MPLFTASGREAEVDELGADFEPRAFLDSLRT